MPFMFERLLKDRYRNKVPKLMATQLHSEYGFAKKPYNEKTITNNE
jgi:hypothetical protein